MGSLRRGLTCATLLFWASPVLAEVCDTDRPDWNGTPVTMTEEALALLLSPAGLILLAGTILALRFRSQWGGLIVVVLWSGFVSLIALADPTGTRALALQEGCIGSPALFIALVIAICAGTILYTAPLPGRTTSDKED